MNRTLIGCASLSASIAVHVWVMLVSSASPAARATPPPPPTFVKLTVAPTPPEERVAHVQEAPAPPVPPPLPKRERRPPTPEPPTPELTAEAPPPTVEAPPPELTGTTLSSADGAGWTMPTGNGDTRDGPLRSGSTRPASLRSATTKARDTKRSSATAPNPTAFVPLSRLSQMPTPPPLAKDLQRNYPPEARNLGRSGEAKVRARIEADGTVRLVEISFETSQGFGEACRNTLLGSRWGVPLDQSGAPAATWVTYRCRFRVND